MITTTPISWARMLMSTDPHEGVPADTAVEGDPDKVEQFFAIFHRGDGES